MAKTITVINNAITLSTAGVSGASKTTLQVGTTTLSLHTKLSKSIDSDLPQGVEVYYTVSPYDVTAAAAPILFVSQAEVMEIKAPKIGGADREFCAKTGLVVGDGAYLYTWVRNGVMTGATTFSLQSVEL